MSQKHQCYDEITNQALALQEAITIFNDQKDDIVDFIIKASPDEIIFIGCTSPYYAGISAAAFWQSLLKIPVIAIPSSELIFFPDSCMNGRKNKPLLIVLSRSGKTTETIMAAELFEKKFPGRSLLIGCIEDSPLEKVVSKSIIIPKAYDYSIPQTRSFTAMYLVALMIGAYFGKQKEITELLVSAPQTIDDIIRHVEPKIKSIFNQHSYRQVFYLSSGYLRGIGQEASLKMMEMSISGSHWFPFLEIRHGPRSLVDNETLVVGLISQTARKYETAVLEELARLHDATTVALDPQKQEAENKSSFSISIDNPWPDEILGLIYLPVIQLLAYYHAVVKGINPDTSRNLTPYIEINRL